LKIISLNLNGIRSATSKGFLSWIERSNPDVVCLQEVRAGRDGLGLQAPNGYFPIWHLPERPGYSGVGIWTKKEPNRIETGMGGKDADPEGRILSADFGSLRIASAYIPSGSSGEERQAFKMKFLARFRRWMGRQKRQKKNVLVCGDFNIAHTEKDLRNWRGNKKNSGFLPEERSWMDRLLRLGGWADVYRSLHPATEGEGYTWWSNRGRAREKNVGWRIDYQIATPEIAQLAKTSHAHQSVRFSDHAPLSVEFSLSQLAGFEW